MFIKPIFFRMPEVIQNHQFKAIFYRLKNITVSNYFFRSVIAMALPRKRFDSSYLRGAHHEEFASFYRLTTRLDDIEIHPRRDDHPFLILSVPAPRVRIAIGERKS